MDELARHPWFGIMLTVFVWMLAKRLRGFARTPLMDPVLISVAVIIGILLLGEIPFESYNTGGRVISFLLGPAVVALAVPFYRQLEKVRRNIPAVTVSVFTGSIVGIVSAAGLVKLFGGSMESILSISPKSVTTPIAMEISAEIGGIPPLTIAVVVITGILGGMLGPEIVRLLGIRSPFAEGIALGTAAHGIGTSRALQENELEGAMSGVGMMLNGLITAIILPVIVRLLF